VVPRLRHPRHMSIAEQALASASVAHHGQAARRIRLEVPGLGGDQPLARRIETYIAAQKGVEQVRADSRTGRVLICYSPEADLVGSLVRFEPPPGVVAPERSTGTEGRYENGSSLTWRSALGSLRDLVDVGRSRPQHPAAANLRPDMPLWHALTSDEVFARTSSGADGLTDAEAGLRLSTIGPNAAEATASRSKLQILAAQVSNLPTVLLLGSAGLSVALGDLFDAGAIVLVLGLNAAVGYRIECKNEQLLASWRKLEAGEVRVVRGGEVKDIPAADLVPGDVIVVRAGDVVPADARVIDAHRLACNEAPLTGESEPQVKQPSPVDRAQPLAERTSMMYAGTVVVGGHGRAVVVATARSTELASVRTLIEQAAAPETPLEKRLARVGRTVSLIGIGAAGATVLVGLVRRQPLVGVLRGAVALGVAAIPEGLPVVATAALVQSMNRMRRDGMVVRRVAAAETLGGVTVVCADKTGTLTQNEMRLEVMDLGSQEIRARQFSADPENPLGDAQSRLLAAGILNSDVDIHNGGNGSEISGSATERALLAAAGRAGLDIGAVRAAFPRRLLRERRDGLHHVCSVHDAAPGRLAVLKGAPEQVVPLCASDERGPLDDVARRRVLQRNAALAADGYRVLAFAWQRLPADAGEPDGGYQLIGLAGLRDPLRDGAAEAVLAAQRAGIRTLILTGDQKATAGAIAREVGLVGEVLDGSELVPAIRRGDPAALRRLANVSVLSRVTPADKLAIVEALRAQGEVVAMAGDGINDAPALKAADVGIAVGVRSSDLARQTADVVLVKEDLRSILTAVGHGRIAQDNIRRASRFLFSTNFSEIALMLGGALFGRAPLTPLQLLWINLLTDTAPAMALALEPGDPNVLARKPARPGAPLFSAGDWGSIVRDGSLMGALGGGAFLLGGSNPAFATLTAAQFSYALHCRPREAPMRPRFAGLVAGSAALQLAALMFAPLRAALRLPPPTALSLGGFAVGLVLPWATGNVGRLLQGTVKGSLEPPAGPFTGGQS
jgi:P-type Ca2+ transporter type 2C